MEIKDLKVGDEVYCSRWGEWPIIWRKSRVEKINEAGLVLVDGVWYGKDGFPNDRSSKIYTIDDEKARFDYESYQPKQQFYSVILEKVDNGDMTYEQFVSICKNILEENDGD